MPLEGPIENRREVRGDEVEIVGDEVDIPANTRNITPRITPDIEIQSPESEERTENPKTKTIPEKPVMEVEEATPTPHHPAPEADEATTDEQLRKDAEEAQQPQTPSDPDQEVRNQTPASVHEAARDKRGTEGVLTEEPTHTPTPTRRPRVERNETSTHTNEDAKLDALLERYKGEFGVLDGAFRRSRAAYMDATKQEREQALGKEKNIRLSFEQARLRDAYLSARSDLLFALSSMNRVGAGYTKTKMEEKVVMFNILDTLVDREQERLGEDDESTLHTFESLEKDILKEAERLTKNKNPLSSYTPERVVAREKDANVHKDNLLALGEMVAKKRQAYQTRMAAQGPTRKGLSRKIGFFSSLFSFIFGTPKGNRR